MTKECITPLRRRMIEDMTVRRLTSEIQRNYIRAVKTFASFLGRSPATAEELRLFQLHLSETHVGPPTINAAVTALRGFSWKLIGARCSELQLMGWKTWLLSKFARWRH
jgi:integrase/recombinase XerD